MDEGKPAFTGPNGSASGPANYTLITPATTKPSAGKAWGPRATRAMVEIIGTAFILGGLKEGSEML